MSVERDMATYDHSSVPSWMRIGAAWSWRLIVIVVAGAGVVYALGQVSEITIALAVALLLAALLQPVAKFLRKIGLPRAAAAGISMVAGIAVVSGVLYGVITTIVNQAPEMVSQAMAGFNSLLDWLAKGPLKIDAQQTDEWIAQANEWLHRSQGDIASFALGVGGSVGKFVSGLGVALFALFFFLFDGRTLWNFLLKAFPHHSRPKVDRAASGGWGALSSYVKVTCVVAAVDAIGIFLGAILLGVPMAPALGALVFLGAFIPIVGAVLSGAVATLVALVTLGWVKALILLGIVLLVQQVESHILQPFLMGRAVSLHPLAVMLGIAAGIILGGIVGGILVIPILAFTKTAIESFVGSRSGELPYQGASTA